MSTFPQGPWVEANDYVFEITYVAARIGEDPSSEKKPLTVIASTRWEAIEKARLVLGSPASGFQWCLEITKIQDIRSLIR
jgi:hypothetical protein